MLLVGCLILSLRVTTYLVNLEMSGQLLSVWKISGNWLKVGEVPWKNPVGENCLLLIWGYTGV